MYSRSSTFLLIQYILSPAVLDNTTPAAVENLP